MNIADFQRMTAEVIQDSGISEYLPTLILPSEGLVMALEGIPSDVSHEDAARK